MTACSISKRASYPLEFKRQSYEKTVDGICRRPNRVVLGLDVDYEVSSLQVKKDSLYGKINYTGERFNPKSNKFEIIPYNKPLYIYKLDTTGCRYLFLNASGENGDFAIEFKNSDGIIGFCYYKLDADNFNVIDAFIVKRKK